MKRFLKTGLAARGGKAIFDWHSRQHYWSGLSCSADDDADGAWLDHSAFVNCWISDDVMSAEILFTPNEEPGVSGQ